jgi:hypothetical protein
MNIFYLDTDPKIAAQYHCDKHVVKMILESAQLLCTAHRVLDGSPYLGSSVSQKRHVALWKLPDERENILYRACHTYHPCGVWVRANIDHYRWLYDLMYYLIYEYKYRYDDKAHKCESLLQPLMNAPNNIPIVDWEMPPQAMPEDSKVPGNSIQAYRNYYKMHKSRFATWKVREVPDWYK